MYYNEITIYRREKKVEEVVKEEKSKFDGHWFQLFGWSILCTLITVCTLFICYPWAVCLKEKWYSKHTIVDGKRLCFDGHAVQLFGNWIKWILLSLITIGIYWVVCGKIAVKKWVVKHTHFA